MVLSFTSITDHTRQEGIYVTSHQTHISGNDLGDWPLTTECHFIVGLKQIEQTRIWGDYIWLDAKKFTHILCFLNMKFF